MFFKFFYVRLKLVSGSMPEWLKGADCKSAALCYVGSNPTRPNKCIWISNIKNKSLENNFSSLNCRNLNIISLEEKTKFFSQKASNENWEDYKPVILLRILYKALKNSIKTKGNTKRNFFFLKKFLNGVRIIKIKPAKLLIKNLG